MGADPLVQTGIGQTPLQTCINRKEFPEMARLLRRAMFERMRESDEPSVVLERGRKRWNPTKHTGVSHLLEEVDLNDFHWSFLFVEAPVDQVSKTYAQATGALRVEQDVEKRRVLADRARFVYRLKGADWTTVLEYLAARFVKPAESVEVAKRVSEATKARVIGFWPLFAKVFEAGREVEHVEFCPKDPDDMESEYPDGYDGMWEAIDEWFKTHKILIPEVTPSSDGLQQQLFFRGLKPGEVERADAVIYKELDFGEDA